MRVWPIACVPAMPSRPKRSATLSGLADLLVDLHAPAAADDGQFRHGGNLRPYGRLHPRPDGEDDVGVVHDMRERRAARFEAAHEGGEIAIARYRGRSLDRTGRCGAVDRKARCIRAAVAHGAEHAGQERSQARVRARGP